MESKKPSILDLAGLLTHKEADELRRVIKENRKRRDIEHKKRIKRIVKAIENSKISKLKHIN